MLNHSLDELSVLIVDVQTSGATPSQGKMLEVAIKREQPAEASDTADIMYAGFINHLDLEEIPARIQKITGISLEDLRTGIAETQLVDHLERIFVAEARPIFAVAHFANFEKRFLDDLFMRHRGTAFPIPLICTYELARRLHQTLPSRSLRALAGFYGLVVPEAKRAASHVTATALIWRSLVKRLSAEGIRTQIELEVWLRTKAKVDRTSPRDFPLPKAKRLGLPKAPGVYMFKGANGSDLLYVGKAKSLRSRVNSYFTGFQNKNARLREMLSQAYDVHFEACATALEAAILENRLIKAHQPPYNVALRRDDRQPIWLDKNFLSMSAHKDAIHKVGPFAHIAAWHDLVSVSLGLATGVAPAISFLPEVAADILQQGFELFISEYDIAGFDVRNLRTLAAKGMDFLRLDRRLARDAVAEEESEEALTEETAEKESVMEWQPADVARVYRGVLKVFARSYLIARRLDRLYTSTVLYKSAEQTQKGWRYLVIRHGQITGQGYLPSRRTLKTFMRTQASDVEPEVFTCLSYDQLRILDTELSILRKQGYVSHVIRSQS